MAERRRHLLRAGAFSVGLWALVLAGGPSTSAASLPPDYFGVAAGDAFVGDSVYRAQAFGLQRQAGVGIVRQMFRWSDFEYQPGRYRFDTYDAYVVEAARKGMRLLPFIFGPPPWRSSRPPGNTQAGTFPPQRPADLGEFVAVLIARYGPQGSLWRERPDLPRVPIRSWQLWNEPHLPVFWASGPDPAEYTALVRASAPAIKRADPGAEVVTAGISDSTTAGAVPLSAYVDGMYRAGLRGSANALGVHPYDDDVPGAVRLVETVRAIADRYGDRGVGLWITESGWASAGPPHRFVTSEAVQAQRVRSLLTTLTDRRGSLRLRGVVHYKWRDNPPPDYWGSYTGLLRQDGSAKPALGAFVSTVALLRDVPLTPAQASALGLSPVTRRPSELLGISGRDTFAGSAAYRDSALRQQALAGIGTVRQAFSWRRIEPGRGRRLRLGRHDALVAAAARRGIRVMPVLVDPPRSRSLGAMAGFAARLHRRYGPGGRFWAAHPELAPLPVTAWQVLDAPNRRGRRSGGVSPRRYGSLLAAVRRRLGRRTAVVTGSLAYSRRATAPDRYLRALARARRSLAFDSVGVTPRAPQAGTVLRRVRALRRTMRRGRLLRSRSLWVTDLAWSDGGPRSGQRAGRGGQARKLRAVVTALYRERLRLRLRGIVYSSWRDPRRRARSWQDRAGLIDSEGTQKPAYEAYRALYEMLR